jgi:hypothetical protein
MVTIRDLQIGNYILVDQTVRRVVFINNDPCFADTPCIGFQLGEECSYAQSDSDRISGLAITDEILRGMGFSFHDHFHTWQYRQPGGHYTIELDKDYTALDFGHRPIRRNIRHVHTLQNLFAAVQDAKLEYATDPA